MPLATIGIVLEEGSLAPDFALISDSGDNVSLSQFRGQPVSCTSTLATTHRAAPRRRAVSGTSGGSSRAGAQVVIGVSPDSARKHVKFREKYGLPFRLLADEDHAVTEQYGVWVEKSMLGKKYMGFERSTFVIDPDGRVAKIMRKVKPATHADDVLAALPS